MPRSNPKVEIGGPSRIERPASEEALSRVQTALEGFQFVANAIDLTAENISEIWDVPTNWPDERLVGKQWELSNDHSVLKVLVYDSTVRKKLGELFAEKRGTVPHFHLHGQLNFHQSVENADFSGIMYFLGDGDYVEEIEVFSEYTHASTTDAGFAMTDFANAIGLNRLVIDAQGLVDLPRVEHRVTVMRALADDIAGAMESLQAVASSET